ncbi:cytochrome c oxidase subunit II [Aquicella lusitana]|uniref:Cytochrome c oxidase subunit 2 n=1 Tax=Aquicella lusitana TaxID=254246 RepID=A0A370GHT3_9COXI|nr:cytochrome c oxidase subunit II [Aquicella lusitana]RDI43355.1 cytochrome c oxidase subunit 2 [Aquicella lusitana]VVC73505.1 Cytochrome c oxidase subunit 2 [Aquicella lusitana]
MPNRIGRLILLSCLSLLTSPVYADYQLNMPYGVSPISHEIYDLHMAAFYICCVIAVVVFSVLIYSLIRFRKSKGAQAAQFKGNLLVEVIWTIIPFLILVGLAYPATVVLAHIHDTEKSALTIKITGYQWKWKYEYLDNGIRYFSYLSTTLDQIENRAPKNKWFLLEVDKPLVVPVNTKVKLLITSDDVIHSWWVPELGVKQDAIPGFINENWVYITQPGEYRGQCGELCGINHGFMPIVVKAVSETDFAAWLQTEEKRMLIQNQQAALKVLPETELLSMGKDEYLKNCAMCHLPNGEGMKTSFPALKYSRVVNAPVDETIAYVLHGVPGTPMQAFGKILDDQTMAAIITYIRQSWGNDRINKTRGYPTTVQPKEVKEVRQLVGIQ